MTLNYAKCSFLTNFITSIFWTVVLPQLCLCTDVLRCNAQATTLLFQCLKFFIRQQMFSDTSEWQLIHVTNLCLTNTQSATCAQGHRPLWWLSFQVSRSGVCVCMCVCVRACMRVCACHLYFSIHVILHKLLQLILNQSIKFGLKPTHVITNLNQPSTRNLRSVHTFCRRL